MDSGLSNGVIVESNGIPLSKLNFPDVDLDPKAAVADPSSQRPLSDDKVGTSNISESSSAKYIVVSPYTSPAHLLDLSTVSPPNQLLAKALALMQPTRDDYAVAPYKDSFNWSTVVYRLRHLLKQSDFQWTQQMKFYIVAFRSQLPSTTDRGHLGALDKAAHAEATASGGILKYWFGIPDENGRNLATCTFPFLTPEAYSDIKGIWRDPQDAKRGGAGPGHRQAIRETRALYLEWGIEQLALTIGPDAATWSVTEWEWS